MSKQSSSLDKSLLDDDEITRAQLVMAKRFVGQRCLLDPQVVSPLRLIWRGFQDWAKPIGVKPSAVALRALLDASPWARVEERNGKGSIKTVVHGVSLKA